MRGENFQGWAGVMLPTFGDVLNCNQKGSKNKGSGTVFLHFTVISHCYSILYLKTTIASSPEKIFKSFNPSLISVYLKNIIHYIDHLV